MRQPELTNTWMTEEDLELQDSFRESVYPGLIDAIRVLRHHWLKESASVLEEYVKDWPIEKWGYK